MQPNYGTVQLGTPAVTNAGGQAGLTYLDNFVQLCKGCGFNFVNVHYFVDRSQMTVAQYVQALKDYVDINVPAVQAKHKSIAGLPIVVGKVRINLVAKIIPSLSHHRLTFCPSSGSRALQIPKRKT